MTIPDSELVALTTETPAISTQKSFSAAAALSSLQQADCSILSANQPAINRRAAVGTPRRKFTNYAAQGLLSSRNARPEPFSASNTMRDYLRERLPVP